MPSTEYDTSVDDISVPVKYLNSQPVALSFADCAGVTAYQSMFILHIGVIGMSWPMCMSWLLWSMIECD